MIATKHDLQLLPGNLPAVIFTVSKTLVSHAENSMVNVGSNSILEPGSAVKNGQPTTVDLF